MHRSTTCRRRIIIRFVQGCPDGIVPVFECSVGNVELVRHDLSAWRGWQVCELIGKIGVAQFKRTHTKEVRLLQSKEECSGSSCNAAANDRSNKKWEIGITYEMIYGAVHKRRCRSLVKRSVHVNVASSHNLIQHQA